MNDMRKKRWILLCFIAILILPSFLVHAETKQSKNDMGEGEYTVKDEVVYATLEASGELEQIYVVNSFNVTKSGKIVDYGTYETIKNLTDISNIEQDGEKVIFTAPEGKFYYQGNMNGNDELPWKFSIQYELDGKLVQGEELLGKDGHVKMTIKTAPNDLGNEHFFENYMLQISLTLPDKFQNIVAEDGMIANAGKSKQLTFTVLPGKSGDFVIEADVTDFEMQGIDIAAIPSNLSFEIPNTDEMTKDMETLSDAIKKLHDGVGELKKGVSELNTGIQRLKDGSSRFQDGLSTVTNGSNDLREASKKIHEALNQLATSLNNQEGMNLNDLHLLPQQLIEISNGLFEAADGMAVLKENYGTIYTTLDKAMVGIPEGNISNEEIASLYMSGANKAVIDKLVKTYEAAQIVKGTYNELKDGFQGIEMAISQYAHSIREVGSGINMMAEQLTTSLSSLDTSSFTKLQNGLAELANNYDSFHQGIQQYTNGMDELFNAYSELHSGVEEVANGTNQLEDGVSDLHKGTEELYEKTKDLPDKLQEEIDEMTAEFDKNDFQPISFVSEKNEKINLVQFVIKTKAIEKDKNFEEVEIEEEKKGFWQLLFDLFRRK